MKHYDDVKGTATTTITRYDGTSHSYAYEYISLAKLTDKQVVDVAVDVSPGYGDPILTFHRIMFTDGSSIVIEGSHDVVYMNGSDGEFPSIKCKQLAILYNEQNGFKRINEDGDEDEDYLDPEIYNDE